MGEKTLWVFRRPKPSSQLGKGRRKWIKQDKGSLLFSLPFRKGGILYNLEFFHFILFC